MPSLPQPSLEERLIRLELLVTHLERELGEFQEVALDQARRLDDFERRLRRIEAARSSAPDEPEDDGAAER